jgi:hypothetical protein
MEKAARRTRLEYHRSHLRYYGKHNGLLAQLALRLLLAVRGLANWSAAVAAGDASVRADATALLRLAVGS